MPLPIALVLAAAVASATPQQRVPAADIQRDVAAAVAQRLRDAGSAAQVRGVSGVSDQSLPAGAFALEIGDVAGRWPRTRAGVPVHLRVNGRTVRTLVAWVELRDVRTVMTYANDAGARTRADALRLVPREVDMTCCAGEVVADASALADQRVRRAVRAGAPAMAADFEAMPDVAERQTVEIEVVRGTVRLTTVGTALADGRIGQTIAVRADGAEQPVRARVSAKQKVILDERMH